MVALDPHAAAVLTHRTYFFALLPDEAFAARVRSYKQRCAARVGSQLYLDDPPHLTLYLANFPHQPSLQAAAQDAVRGLRAPSAMACGWHEFRDDPLTGNHTLVCNLEADGRQGLARCQERVCAAVASLRDPDTARYAPAWPHLNETARTNVMHWGFPFVGAIWQPHVTIASIRPADWDAVWAEFKNDPPEGKVRFPELRLYALEQGRPVALERFELESAP